MNGGPKAEQVEKMFDTIAPEYDKLNHVLSLNIDKTWRKRALKYIVEPAKRQEILDIACGTGDFALKIASKANSGTMITGFDLSDGMLEVMRSKVAKAGLQNRISTLQGNCEKMDFPEASFDRVTIGFGIRNFENREAALKEILRVLKPGGKLVILELSVPANPLVRGLYKLYFLNILPWIGGKISGDRTAYEYLPASVLKFPGKKEWMSIMTSCGYRKVFHKAYSLGICRLYVGEK